MRAPSSSIIDLSSIAGAQGGAVSGGDDVVIELLIERERERAAGVEGVSRHFAQARSTEEDPLTFHTSPRYYQLQGAGTTRVQRSTLQ
jgi:hypothetical protein